MADCGATGGHGIPLDAPILGLKMTEQQQQKVNEDIALLVQRHFRAEIFTIRSIENGPGNA